MKKCKDNVKNTHSTALRVGILYLGCCMGAGYLSGQELFQFFGSKGVWGFAGLLVATVAIFCLGYLMLSLARDTGEGRMDRIVVWFDCKPLCTAVAVFEVLFLFMTYTLCVAGFGSFLHQLVGLPTLFGEGIICLFCLAFAPFGVRGLSRFFTLAIPPLAIFTIFVSAFAICTANGMDFVATEVGGLLTGFWAFDGLTYAVFCLFCSLPVLVPLGSTLKGGKVVRHGTLLGAALIGGIALIILLALATLPTVTQAAFPMLALSLEKSPVMGAVYGGLLAAVILSAGFSSLCSMSEYFMQRFSRKKRFLLPVLGLISLISLALGLFGFEGLIGFLYPVFGYIGFLPLGLLLVHAVIFYRKQRSKK